jgi:hypothetical protein
MPKKKKHLPWNEVDKSKWSGSLGLRKLEFVNQSLNSKLIWRMLRSLKSLWRKVISHKYLKGIIPTYSSRIHLYQMSLQDGIVW